MVRVVIVSTKQRQFENHFSQQQSIWITNVSPFQSLFAIFALSINKKFLRRNRNLCDAGSNWSWILSNHRLDLIGANVYAGWWLLVPLIKGPSGCPPGYRHSFCFIQIMYSAMIWKATIPPSPAYRPPAGRLVRRLALLAWIGRDKGRAVPVIPGFCCLRVRCQSSKPHRSVVARVG